MNVKKFSVIVILLLTVFLAVCYVFQKKLLLIYNQQFSAVIKDRKGEIVFIKPNQSGYFIQYSGEIPLKLKKLLIEKEDKFFYNHPGFNPGSIFQAVLGYFGIGNRKASSTITQQLVKILLGKEFDRSLKNKVTELFYALSLEVYLSKEEILQMYANSIYFGNQLKGISEASQSYFNLPPDLLSEGQILQLLATISNPNENNPLKNKNKEIALSLAESLNLNKEELAITDTQTVRENLTTRNHFSSSYFEIQSLLENINQNDSLTIDKELTEKLRDIVKRNIDNLKFKNAKNAALVVIKLPENELLALIGSPNPDSLEDGYKINMLEKPRPIGSTLKPFIYLKSFEKGLRPYTLVEDREYKYITALGFPLYPKNFDYKYRGEVNLHYALSNSLNVPAVKVLEFVGLEDFYNFLKNDLEFEPVQDLGNYQLGIALGSLEMSLLDLARYFTIFSNNGILKELRISSNSPLSPEKEITKPEYIQLVNKILNDRKTGVEQFGLKSELNLFQENYALKTGTSRDFKDSWIVGYTPDFLVGVWVGNPDNTSMDEISGQMGAGRIWAEAMELILNSEYNKNTPFEFSYVKDFYNGANVEYGLADDDYEKALNVLTEEDSTLILTPHQDDLFLLEANSKIILKAKENVNWFINEEFLGEGIDNIFTPLAIGPYQIMAETPNKKKEVVTIWISE
jgi:penicillin-binding protein 1C